MTTIANTEPSSIQAGDRLQWTRTDLVSGYPASAYTLTYALVKAGSYILLTASADGETFAVDVPSATTASYSPGVYSWQAYVTSAGGERTKIDEGTVEVQADFATATAGLDNRSTAAKIVDAIDAVLGNRATDGQKAYTIQGRAIEHYSPSQLLELRKHYLSILIQEQRAEAASNGKSVGKHKFAFGEL